VRLLAVNAGSTSVKVTIVESGERIQSFPSLDDAFAAGTDDMDAVVHRVVHGGDRTTAVVVDDEVLDELRSLTPLAPLHQPAALEALARCRAAVPGRPQVACFDTAFHSTIPVAARTYALPARLREQVKVYGFHGLSHRWSASRVAMLAPGARRLLVAHLGGGQSLCGVVDGRSVVTTMGFTPLDGLVMATRCGAIDPGALLYLEEHTHEDLGHVLEEESGLAGLAGTSDMREVVERATCGDADAELALDVWTHRFAMLAGGCVAAMAGLDALVFTGGVGEHSSVVRARAAGALEWIGVSIEDGGSEHGSAEEISADGAAVCTFVIEAAEDLAMAAEARSLLEV
jgi:acetate kinase